MPRSFLRHGCGLDISKAKLATCFGGYTEEGVFVVLSTKTFKNTPAGIGQLTAWLDKLTAKYLTRPELAPQVALESTGSYHERVLQTLHEENYAVSLLQPRYVKRFLQSLGQISKNDALDARGICRLACERPLRRWEPFSDRVLAVRDLLRHRASLVRQQTRYKNQLHALGYRATNHRTLRKSLKKLLRHIGREIDLIEGECLKIYRQDEQLVAAITPIERSLKGVGLLTLLVLFAETNGFRAVGSARQLARFAGLDIIENQSGNFTGRTRISKRGNARIRGALYMNALQIAKQKEGPLYAFYLRINARNPKTKQVGLVALERKLLVLVYTLFKTGTEYDPNHQWGGAKPKVVSEPAAGKQPPQQQKSTPEGDPGVHGIVAARGAALPLEG